MAITLKSDQKREYIKPYNISGCVGYWDFENITGSYIPDGLGLGHGGSIIAPKGDVGAGRYGSGLKAFDQTSSGIQAHIYRYTELDNLGSNDSSLTVCLWINGSNPTVSATNRIIEKLGSGVYPFVVRYNQTSGASTPGSIGLSLYNAVNNPTQVVGGTPNLNTWYHYAGVRDTATGSIYCYVNGFLLGSTRDTTLGTAICNSGNISFANVDTGLARPFNGLIDELAIFNRALSQEEIKKIVGAGYQTGTEIKTSGTENKEIKVFDSELIIEHKTKLESISPTDIENCVAYYDFEEGSGSTINDKTGNGNNGVLTSGTFVDGKIGNFGLQCTNDSYSSPSQYVLVPNSETLEIGSGDVTVSLWVNHNMVGSLLRYPMPLVKDGANVGSAGRYGFNMQVCRAPNEDCVFETYSSGNGRSAVHSFKTNDGEWHHVAGIKTNTYLKVFVDGSGVTATQSVGDVSCKSGLGLARKWNSSFTYSGKIDEVALYNRALSDREIGDLYRHGREKFTTIKNSNPINLIIKEV